MEKKKTVLNNRRNTEEKPDNKKASKVTSAVIGGVVGAVAGLLINPKKLKDKENTNVKARGNRAGSMLKDWKDQTKGKSKEVIQRLKNKSKNSGVKEKNHPPAIEGTEFSQKPIASSEREAAAASPVNEADNGERQAAGTEDEEAKTQIANNDDTVR